MLLLLVGGASLLRTGLSVVGLFRYAAAASMAAARGSDGIGLTYPALGAGRASAPETGFTPAGSAPAALAVSAEEPRPGLWAMLGPPLLQHLGLFVSGLLRLRTGSATAAPRPLPVQSSSQRGASPQRALLQLPPSGAAAAAAAALTPAQRFGYGTLTRAAALAPAAQGPGPSPGPAPALSLLQLLLPRRMAPAPAPAPAPSAAPANGRDPGALQS